MCGIFAILNNKYAKVEITKHFIKGRRRGPENSTLTWENNVVMGFHRLAINGLKDSAMQPLKNNNIFLICNGEIYNSKVLHETLQQKNNSGSDCEIILHLYKKYGIHDTLKLIDGVFAFVIFDFNKNVCYAARDMFGVRPLFIAQKNDVIAFASTLAPIANLDSWKPTPFSPGTLQTYKLTGNKWEQSSTQNYTTLYTPIRDWDIEEARKQIRYSLTNAVKKRVFSTDRPIACLLSGGLDSSLITSIVSGLVKENGGILETYSIGLKGSVDLKYARIVANYLQTNHTEIICTEKDFLDAIPEVIEAIESYDTTSVRASVGNYLIGKYIAKHSDAKVIFNGDGSDEICGGYLYFHEAPNCIDFDLECKRLLSDIHYFDVLRSDRSISSNGLEPRTPFLDPVFVKTYLSIPRYLRAQKDKCEKYLLRTAFVSFLPHEVLWRTKEAFSDGVSSQKKSWFEIIQNHMKTQNIKDHVYIHNKPTTLEQRYYRNIFNELFPNCEKTIPYFWMPRFVEATDSSARTLNIYKKT